VILDGTGGGVSVFIAADSIDQLRPSDEAVPIQKKKLEGFELMRSESLCLLKIRWALFNDSPKPI